MSTKNIVAVDLGFGSTKIAYRNHAGNITMNKVISAVAEVPSNSVVKDENTFEFDGKYYYLFGAALKLPEDKLINMMSYEGLKTASPIILRNILKGLDFEPDKLVLGLSISMIGKSAEYKKYISEQLNISSDKIRLVPQGVGSKATYDLYGLRREDESNIRSENYLGVDIGFNTVDVFQVITKKVSSNTVEGIEGEGVIKVANLIIDSIYKSDNHKIDIQDAKEIIDKGYQVYRSERIDRTELIKESITSYLVDLIKLLEERYSTTINKMDNILLIGGGAAILRKYHEFIKEDLDKLYSNEFLLIPNEPEYYNVLGYYLIGLKTVENE